MKRNVKSESVKTERDFAKPSSKANSRIVDASANKKLHSVDHRLPRLKSARKLEVPDCEFERSRYSARKSSCKNDSSLQLRPSRRSEGYHPGVTRRRPTSEEVLYASNQDGYGQDNRILASQRLHCGSDLAPPNLPNVVESFNMKTTMSKKPVRIHLLNNDSVVLVFEVSIEFLVLVDFAEIRSSMSIFGINGTCPIGL